MKTTHFALITYLTSAVLFVAGNLYPIMGSKLFLSIQRSEVYLWSTIRDFYRDHEWFIASLLLLFTFLLPIAKYLFLGIRLIKGRRNDSIHYWLELINKWAMLDVFVLAVVIVNLKFDSLIIVTEIRIGTTFFILSILLLMLTSWLLSRTKTEI